MTRLWAIWVTTLLAILGCVHRRPAAPAPVPSSHYVLGDAYRAGQYWFYPAEDYGLDSTGIAAVQGGQAGLTADGELRDTGGLTASMQTIQLPAIVQVTNLENGRQIELRVNDRGPASPGRIIAVSPRAAALLAMPADGGTRVRVRIDGGVEPAPGGSARRRPEAADRYRADRRDHGAGAAGRRWIGWCSDHDRRCGSGDYRSAGARPAARKM